MNELESWLTRNGLEAIAPAFAENDISLDILTDLTDADLREMGLSIGMRRRFNKALANDGEAPPEPSDNSGVSQQSASPDHAGAERRHLSVMFVDLVGSTELSREMDPEEMNGLLRAYQNSVVGEIARFNGHVAKFMGDGVLAYFGWPRAHEDDVEQSVRSGLSIIEAVGRLSTPKGQPLQSRVGVATGLVVVGDLVGDLEARERTVTGETPNLAARLQGAANPDCLVISETTARLVSGLFTVQAVNAGRLKGFGENETAHLVTGEQQQISRFEARHGQSATPIVGREQELSLLTDRWAQAENGEGQGVLIIGDAGIGKSRLLRAVFDSLRDANHFRIRYQCSPNFQDVALWPVTQHLRRAYDFSSADTARARAQMLTKAMGAAAVSDPSIVELFAELLDIDVGDRGYIANLTAQQQRHRTLEALKGQLLQLCTFRPVLLVLEDAHWADPTTLEFLELSLEAVGQARCLILLTSRPDNLPGLASHRQVSQLNLNRLGRHSSDAIVRSIIGNVPVSQDVLDNILSRTDGVPLFVEELTKTLLEAGLLDDNGSLGPGAGNTKSDYAIPLTLYDSLMARLDHLNDAKQVAQIASCIGREFDYRLLYSIASHEQTNLVAALDRLVEAELVFRHGEPPQATYVFKHALVRDAAYESLLISNRRQVHANIVAKLESTDEDVEPELIAQHAELAGDTDKAIIYYTQAGGEAAAGSANAESARVYANALRAIRSKPETPERDVAEIECLLAMGLPQIAGTGYASNAVADTYRRALDLSEKTGQELHEFVAIRGLWNCIYDQGDVNGSLALANRLFDLAHKDGSISLTALALRAVGSSQLNLCQLDDALENFSKVLDLTRNEALTFSLEEHGEIPQIVASLYTGYINGVRGNLDLALECGSRAVALARQAQHPLSSAFTLAIFGVINLLRRDYAACLEAEQEVAELSVEHGLVFWAAHSDIISGSAKGHLGDWETGLPLGEQGIRNWRSIGALLHIPTWSSYLADAAVAAGQLEIAERAIADGLQVSVANDDLFALGELQRLDGAVAALRGRSGEAAAKFTTAIETSQTYGTGLSELRAHTQLAELAAGTETASSVRQGLERILGHITEFRTGPDYVRAVSALEPL